MKEETYKVDVCEGEFLVDSFDGNERWVWGTEYSCSNCGGVLNEFDKLERCPYCKKLLDWNCETD